MASTSQLWTFPNSRVTEAGEEARATRAWQNWFGQVSTIGFSITQSGPTADRPAERLLVTDPPSPPLWIGRQYFDTDLGIPIWIQSIGPLVWVDATGAPV